MAIARTGVIGGPAEPLFHLQMQTGRIGRVTTEPGDAELLARVAAGDVDAFRMLYDRYAGAVYSLAYGMLRDAHTAQDVAQDVLV
ncbi:MAG TPA: sigma factor [bacterium]|nr:sigma factor [bacterium]